MNRNRFSLILILLLCGLAACAANVPIPGPDPDEIELDPDVVDIGEGSTGTAILNVEHNVDFIPGFFFDIDESFTIYIAATESRNESMIAADIDGMAEISITGTGTVGVHILSGQAPVNFEVAGWFHPYPRCAFEITITEYLALSEMTSIESSIVGTIPAGEGEDQVTFFPTITLSGPEYSYVFPSSFGLSVSVDNVLLEGDTGCTFLFND